MAAAAKARGTTKMAAAASEQKQSFYVTETAKSVPEVEAKPSGS